MADVTNYQSQTHQFRYKQDSDPEAVRRSPDMAAMAEWSEPATERHQQISWICHPPV